MYHFYHGLAITRSSIDLAATVFIISVGSLHAFKSDGTFNHDNFTWFIRKYAPTLTNIDSAIPYCLSIRKKTIDNNDIINCNNYIFSINSAESYLSKLAQLELNYVDGKITFNQLINFLTLTQFLLTDNSHRSLLQQLDISNQVTQVVNKSLDLLNQEESIVCNKDVMTLLWDIMIKGGKCIMDLSPRSLGYSKFMQLISSLFPRSLEMAKNFSKIEIVKLYLNIYIFIENSAQIYTIYNHCNSDELYKIKKLFLNNVSRLEDLFSSQCYVNETSLLSAYCIYCNQVSILDVYNFFSQGLFDKDEISSIKDLQKTLSQELLRSENNIGEKIFDKIKNIFVIAYNEISSYLPSLDLCKYQDSLTCQDLEENLYFVANNFDKRNNVLTINIHNESTIL